VAPPELPMAPADAPVPAKTQLAAVGQADTVGSAGGTSLLRG